jgi:hypothetical protein
VFLYYCPEIATPKIKMSYSTFKATAVKVVQANGIEVGKQFECNEPSDIKTDAFLFELYPKMAEKKLITKAKPKQAPVPSPLNSSSSLLFDSSPHFHVRVASVSVGQGQSRSDWWHKVQRLKGRLRQCRRCLQDRWLDARTRYFSFFSLLCSSRFVLIECT